MKGTFTSLAVLATLGCLVSQASQVAAQDKRIAIDGSSTVFPAMEAIAEEFQKANKGIKVTVGISGTGGLQEVLPR